MTDFFEIVFFTAWAIVLYSYVVFPLLLAVTAKFSPFRHAAPELPDDELPTVSMIVAAYNEESVLPAKVQNALAMDYPADKVEILIGSDGSSDRTCELLQAVNNSRIRFISFQSRRGKISVLNDLIRMATGEIIVMSDANTTYAPDALRKMVRHYADPAIGCVSGQLLLDHGGGVSGEGIYWRYESWIKKNSSRIGFLIGCNGGIFSMRREYYTALPATTIVEDFVLTLRVIEQGKRVILDTDAVATEPPAPSTRAEMMRKIRIGAGNWQALSLTWRLLLPRYGAVALTYWGQKVLRWCAPVLIITALVANAFLLQTQMFAAIFELQLASMAVAAIGAHPQIGPRFPKPLRPITYFYVMNYALLCGLFRYLFKTQKVTWERHTTALSTE